MIPRYTNLQMGKIWAEESKFEYWLKIEKAVSVAQAELGIIPKKASDDIVNYGQFDIEKINDDPKMSQQQKEEAYSKILDKYGYKEICCRIRIMGLIPYHKIINT